MYKLLRMIWIISTFLLVAAYNGNLRASLIIPVYEEPPRSGEEIIERYQIYSLLKVFFALSTPQTHFAEAWTSMLRTISPTSWPPVGLLGTCFFLLLTTEPKWEAYILCCKFTKLFYFLKVANKWKSPISSEHSFFEMFEVAYETKSAAGYESASYGLYKSQKLSKGKQIPLIDSKIA